MSIIDKIRALFGGSASDGASGDEASACTGDTPTDMIPCEDALKLVHEFLDGELGDVPQAQVKAHFEVCKQCYPHLQLETAFRDAVQRATSGEEAPQELKSRVAALIAEAEAEG